MHLVIINFERFLPQFWYAETIPSMYVCMNVYFKLKFRADVIQLIILYIYFQELSIRVL
jgi:hypothetical protein